MVVTHPQPAHPRRWPSPVLRWTLCPQNCLAPGRLMAPAFHFSQASRIVSSLPIWLSVCQLCTTATRLVLKAACGWCWCESSTCKTWISAATYGISWASVVSLYPMRCVLQFLTTSKQKKHQYRTHDFNYNSLLLRICFAWMQHLLHFNNLIPILHHDNAICSVAHKF